MPLHSLPPDDPIPFGKALRHLLIFQLKLFVDAFRDLIFSPISLIVFIVDSITRPAVKNSMSRKMMHLGRKTDRVINLFGEYSGSGDYTIDATVAEVETVLQQEMAKRKKAREME